MVIRSGNILYGARVRKIAKSLSNRYSVFTLGWNRKGYSKTVSEVDISYNLFNLKAPLGKTTLVVYYPFFWMWVLFKLIVLRPKIVHACDLDSALPSYIYKILFRKKLVFDICDRFGMANFYKSKLLGLVNALEESLARKSDVLITVAQKLIETFQKKPEHYTLILNCPEDHTIKKISTSNSQFTLVYTGPIMRGRGIERIAEAIKDISGVLLVIAGWVIDKEFFNQITKLPNVKYEGVLTPVKALELESSCDAMISLYNMEVLNYRYAMPNKTFEAMMCGIPLITNVALELTDEIGCGIKVEHNDLNQIRSAIISLRDNGEMRKTLGTNGRRAFEEKYNWGIMEKKLYQIYDGLLKKDCSEKI